MKIASYLPVFNGYYGTFFEPNEDFDSELEHFISETGNENLTENDLQFDYKDYENRVAESCVSEIQNELNHFTDNGVIEVEFESISSPREYNFGNDSINVIYTLDKAFLADLRDFLNANIESVAEYIKERYTSRDGFSSFYSNDYKDWLDDLDTLIGGGEIEDVEHKFGSLLETYFEIEGYTDQDLSDAVASEMYLIAELK